MKKIIFFMLFALVGWQQAEAQNSKADKTHQKIAGPPATPLAVGDYFTYDNLNYLVTTLTTVEVRQNNGYFDVVIIPASVTYKGEVLSVTVIGEYAFDGRDSLTSISIPNTVTSIGHAAFYACQGLTSVTIPDSVTSIGDEAFSGCGNLSSITIPNTVTSIGVQAFFYCSALTTITIPNSVTSIGDYAFEGCSGLTSVISNTTTPIVINANVFQGVNQASCSLKAPAGSVAAYEVATVWKDFSPITCITTDNTTTAAAYGTYTWANNGQTYTTSGVYTGLTANCVTEKLDLTITTPPADFTINGIIYAVTSANTVSVTNQNRLASGDLAIPAQVTYNSTVYAVTSIIKEAFFRCDGLTSIIIPNSVTSIGEGAFIACSGLISATIPSSVTSIIQGTFISCSSLTSVVIPSSVTSIGDDAFSSCSGLTSVTIPNSVSSIGYNAFRGCTSLTSVNCNVTTPIDIDASVFSDVNQGVCSLFVPAASVAAYQAAAVWQLFSPISCIATDNTTAVTTCGSYTWANNSQTFTATGIYTGTTTNCVTEKLDLTITVPPTSFTSGGINYEVTSSTTVAVGNNTGASGDIIIPASVTTDCSTYAVTSIDSNAFINCNGLTSVSIPSSVTTIGDNAFANCSSLYSVTVDWATPIIIDSNVFDGLDLATISLNFPNDQEIAYNNAAVWTNFHNSVDIIRVFNYCKDAITAPLPAPFPAGRTVIWYSDDISGIALASAPTPETTTVGTKVFFVSQVLGGVESALETVTVNTIALLETPTAITGSAELGTLVRTNNTATYSIEPVIDAVSYIWTAPAGVNIVSGQGTTEITVNFADVAPGAGAIGNLSALAVNSNNCNSLAVNLALSKVLPNAPEAIKMTDATLPVPGSGIATAVTTFGQYMGTAKIVTLTATPVEGAWSYIWELPVGVNLLSGATTNDGITTGTNVITVNLAGVTSSSTYSHTRVTGVLTHVLRFGVKAVTGVGGSITDNALVVNPTTASTARLLTVFAAVPAASSSIKMTDADGVDPTKAITVISPFIGTNKVLTLTAGLSVTASSYRWELPTGVTKLSGGNSNVITVNFANLASGISSLYIGVIAVNGIGESTSGNSTLVPATTSTARLLRLTAGVPAAVSVVTGQFSGLCENLTYSYAIRPSILANNYQIMAPAGAVVKSDSNMSNASNVLTTPDLNFTITYPSGFVSTPLLLKTFSVRAINGVGASLTNRVLSLSTRMTAIGTATGSAGITNFSKTGTQTFTIPAVVGATNYVWTVFDGAEIVSGQGTNLVEIDFKAVTKTSTKLSVIATNACGIATTVKSYILKVVTARSASIESFSFNTNEVYPVPVSSFFNVNITTTTNGTLEISIYSLDGFAVMNSKSVQLKKGLNTITENASFLKAGVYILQLTNPSTSEVITKKLIKE